MESEILGFGIRNTAQRIQNPISTVAQSVTAIPFVDGNFNFTHGNFNLIVLGNFNFTHGNFNLLTAISIYSQQFQFYARQIQFTYEQTEITVSKIEISPLQVSIHVVQNWHIGTQKSHWGKTNNRHA